MSLFSPQPSSDRSSRGTRMRLGTGFRLASLFLSISIVGFAVEVSVLYAMYQTSSTYCSMYTPSAGWHRVDCIDPNRPFVILPPVLGATGAVAFTAVRARNRQLALRFSRSVLIALGILFVTLGIFGLESDISFVICTIYGCPSVFSSAFASDWDKITVGSAMIASGIVLAKVSTATMIDKKSMPVKTDSLH